MRLFTAILTILAAVPDAAQAMLTEAEERDQQLGQVRDQDQGLRGGGVPERKLPGTYSRGNTLPGMGSGNGGGNAGGNGGGNGGGNAGGTFLGEAGDDVGSPDYKPNQRYATGNVIVSRKSERTLMKEGKNNAEIQAIRAQGKNEINKNTVLFESEGEDDFQVIQVGAGREAAYIASIKNNPAKADLYTVLEAEMIERYEVSTNDPYITNQYHHTNMQTFAAWETETGDAAVTIGICDTGLQLNHPDLADNLLEGYHAPSQTWQNAGGPVDAVHPHGTMCAGCAAAIGNNGVGVSGVGWNFKHRVGRVTDSPGGGASSAHLADCARKMCAKPDVKVVSVSYSGVEGQARREAATYCKSQGALMVNAAGNDNRDLTQFGHADDDDLIVAGATDINDNKSGFSAYGAFVDVWAPGSAVATTTVGSSYAAVSGTSFSCPLVAGLIALIWSKNPELTPNEVETILKQSTDMVGNLGNQNTAYGRINALTSVLAAGSGTPFPTSAPTTPPPTPFPTTAAPTVAPEPTITATLDGTLGVPKCATVGGACTSGALLNGRASLGPEPNAPNTIDTCTDGSAGGYHSDESNDAIEVFATNGGFLKVGEMATVKATVWAWASGSSDTADFYVSNTATNPNWVHIGSVQPPGGGASVLESPSFELTTTLQAVRVNFRYGGSASSCTTGGYDDSDDLVFAVAPISPSCPHDECIDRCVVRYGGDVSSLGDSYYCAKGCAGMSSGAMVNPTKYCSVDEAERYVICLDECENASSVESNRAFCRYGCEFWEVVATPTTSDPTPAPTPNPTTADPTAVPTPNPTTADPTAVPTPNPTTADPTPTPCVQITVEIRTDDNPDQTSWTMADECTGDTVIDGPIVTSPNTVYSNTFCLPPSVYKFTIIDSIGNGLSGSGSYTVFADGEVVTQGMAFASSASASFGNGCV